MSEAKNLRRIDRDKAQRRLEPDVQQPHAIAQRARHIEHGARERAVWSRASSLLHGDFFAVEGKSLAPAADWRHRIGYQYGPRKPAQGKAECCRMNVHPISNHTEAGALTFQRGCDRA